MCSPHYAQSADCFTAFSEMFLLQQVVHRKGVSEKKSLFRGWNRLCINAASLSAAEKSLASITAAASFARASATDVELEAPNAKAGTKGMTQGEEQHTGDTKRRAKEIEQLLREQRVQRARHLVGKSGNCVEQHENNECTLAI